MFDRVIWTIKTTFISTIICIATLNFSQAEIIEQKLPTGVIATAEYQQGDETSPAIMILHGFLQTRESHTVHRLYNSLTDSGFTVLSPTLSLGINHRKQSLACEAIHSHTMQSDIDEIDLWTRWLHKKSNKKVILIGHSTGSVQQLAYLNQNKYSHIDRGIFISLSYFGEAPGSNETEKDGKRAKEDLNQGNDNLQKYGLTYCKEYVTTPSHYLSYYEWQPKKLLETMNKISIPISVLVGSKDQRISKNWVNNMNSNGITIITINGAGHFFDDEYEFDLLDNIETLLTTN